MDCVLPVVSKIGDHLAAQISDQLGYLIFYGRKFENLELQVRKLKGTRISILQSVDEARRNGAIIGAEVEQWMKMAYELLEEAEKIIEYKVNAGNGCVDGLCPNVMSRYLLSKKAKEMTEDVMELCGKGNFFGANYFAPGPFTGLESRVSLMNEVMDALRDKSINIIALCGMGGAGKTVMAKEVARKAEGQKLFDEVLMAVLSPNPDLIEIQGQMADRLGLNLFGITLTARARELWARILSSKRVLVILDDLWEPLHLAEIGIPFGDDHKGCKIVLTSRSEDVCSSMGAQVRFRIGVLSDEEGWNLFKEKAGISDDTSQTSDLHSMQKAVANECEGLPLAIVTIASALRGKYESSWDAALQQLRNPVAIRKVDARVRSSIELSFNYLESEEAKKCFLLCSLFPEDSDIPVEDIVRYGFGLEWFDAIGTVDEARDRVHSLVADLKNHYFLMSCPGEEHVKMHDVLRDVAISIASRTEHSFMVRCDKALKEWPEEDRNKDYAAISVQCNDMWKLPDNLECPKLQLLRLEFNRDFPETPDCFYEGMTELKVLVVLNMRIGSLPKSLRCLANLQTLMLHDCTLFDDISAIGALENIEILSFTGSRIQELPKEIGKLGRLKLLDLLGCYVERISPGVLGSLSNLEELYVGDSFEKWEVAKDEKQKTNACIEELADLSNLVALDVLVPHSHWPRDLVLRNVKKFKISVGCGIQFRTVVFPLFPNTLALKVDMSDLMQSGIKMLLKSTKNLFLESVAGLKNILCDADEFDFEQLTDLSLSNCGDLEYLINTTVGVPQRGFPMLKKLYLDSLDNFKGICHCQLPKEAVSEFPEFRKLTSIELVNCKKLQSVLSITVARSLIQLRKLKIDVCEMMEVVFYSEGAELEIEAEDKIVFPQLNALYLRELPVYTTFCKAMNAVELPQLNKLELYNIPEVGRLGPASETNYDTTIPSLFNDKVTLASIEELHISDMDNLIEIWPGELQAKLREMTVYRCDKLLRVHFTSNLIECMQNLELLEVGHCESVEVVFDLRGINITEGHPAIALPSLANLQLLNLPKLKHVWAINSEIQGFGNLRSLSVQSCNSLANLFSPSLANLLLNLQELAITDCAAMETIIAREHEKDEVTRSTIIFPQLISLVLIDLPNLTSFCPQACTFKGPFLKTVKVINCPKMEARLPSAFQRMQEL